ncbi:hypothetical protein ABE85_05420 [Mitsuaria sp. 7]|nr:hypothetical protein ABE85_05420 [Mitsuaria sp. 7]
MSLHPSESAFLAQLAVAKNSWLTAAQRALASEQGTEPWSETAEAWARLRSRLCTAEDQAAWATVIDELLGGLLHSALVTLDGGSALAETTLLSIEDSDGHQFKTHLHEYWPEALDAAGEPGPDRPA